MNKRKAIGIILLIMLLFPSTLADDVENTSRTLNNTTNPGGWHLKSPADEVEKYIKDLKDEKYPVRANAAYALKELNDTRAVVPLIQALNDRISNVREGAIRALGKMADPRAIDPLIQTLKKETDDHNRGEVAKALKKFGDPKAIDPLVQELDKGNFGCDTLCIFCCSNIIEALGEIGDDRAVRPLSRILLSDKTNPSRDIKYKFNVHASDPVYAAHALGKIGKKGYRSAVDALIDALSMGPGFPKNSYYNIRAVVVEELANTGDPRVVDLLIKVHEDENEDFDVRKAAGDGLQKLPTL